MRRFLMAVAMLATTVIVSPTFADTHQTSAGPVKVTKMITGLDNPWAVAFLPNGKLLITERDGTLLIALALRRCSSLTPSRVSPNTSAAVARWIS